jgi:nucleoid-associated protein EbfC
MDPFDDVLAQVMAEQRRVEEIQRSVARMTVTGRSRNGEVSATLRANQFTEISINPRALQRYNAESIGTLVLEAVNDGLQRFAEASRSKFEPLIAAARLNLPTTASPAGPPAVPPGAEVR